MNNSYYLSVDELAERWGVQKSWLYRRTMETGPDAIPRVRMGKYLRFRWEDVQDWLEKQNQNI